VVVASDGDGDVEGRHDERERDPRPLVVREALGEPDHPDDGDVESGGGAEEAGERPLISIAEDGLDEADDGAEH